jgi:hypothetical protein
MIRLHRFLERVPDMVERKKELKQRYHRKQKLAKLKSKLSMAKDPREREKILQKIHLISPWWTEPAPQS